jgi:hypothetical protein
VEKSGKAVEKQMNALARLVSAFVAPLFRSSPREAGVQAVFFLGAKTKLDSRLRGNDEQKVAKARVSSFVMPAQAGIHVFLFAP